MKIIIAVGMNIPELDNTCLCKKDPDKYDECEKIFEKAYKEIQKRATNAKLEVGFDMHGEYLFIIEGDSHYLEI